MHLLRRPLPALFFFGSSLLVAAGLFLGLREILPYEALRRTTPEQQFQAWEGAVWMVGLVLLLLSGTIIAENLNLLRKRDEGYSVARDLREGPAAFALLPWWMLSTGAVLLVLATWARSQLPM